MGIKISVCKEQFRDWNLPEVIQHTLEPGRLKVFAAGAYFRVPSVDERSAPYALG